MELSRGNFRAFIFYDFCVGLTQQQCIDRLKIAFGNEAPSKTMVYNWYNEFKRKRKSLKDEPREGRPKTAVVPENIDAVRKLIEVDRHVTYREIGACLGIGVKSIHTILHEHLGVRKLCARWIPHKLTDAQKKNRVDWCRKMLDKFNRGASNLVYNIVTGDESWIYAYEPERKGQSTVWIFQREENPTKVTRSRSTAKQMVACFFTKTGHVATVALENQKTVNSAWYTTICLPEVFGELRRNNAKRRIILHHDNASSHTSHQTSEYLGTQNIELMGHPPYSPDLAPKDFFLFTKIKDKLRDQRFSSPEEAVEAFKNHVLELSHSDWQKCFDNWFERMHKCINLKGGYFKKQ
jgi:histone-lysine N-methyltransferase SETMAR